MTLGRPWEILQPDLGTSFAGQNENTGAFVKNYFKMSGQRQ